MYTWNVCRRVKQETNEWFQHPNFRCNWLRYFRSHTGENEGFMLRNINTCPSACQLQPLILISFPRTSREGSRLRFTFVSLLLSEFIIVIHFRVPEIHKCSFTHRRINLHHKIHKNLQCNRHDGRYHIIASKLNFRIMCITLNLF